MKIMTERDYIFLTDFTYQDHNKSQIPVNVTTIEGPVEQDVALYHCCHKSNKYAPACSSIAAG